jgi:uncharacterized protein YggE
MNELLNDLASNRMLRYAAFAVLVLLALFLLVQTWDSAFGRGQYDPVNSITVEGTGTVAAVPDIAQISFTVLESANTVADAQAKATERTDAAIEALKKAGIDDKDVKTVHYSVSPRYEYDQPCPRGAYCATVVSGAPRIVGYDVSQSIEVKVRDTGKAGEILGLLGELGVQNISGPNFTMDDEDAVRAEARGEAIDEAEAKAKVLARQLGVRLVRVMSFSESGGPYPMYGYGKGGGVMMDAVAQSAPALPVGENETNVTVVITYEIR